MFKKEDFIFNEGFSLYHLYFYNLRDDVMLVLESPSRSNLTEDDTCFVTINIDGINDDGEEGFNIELGRSRVSQIAEYLNENRKEIIGMIFKWMF